MGVCGGETKFVDVKNLGHRIYLPNKQPEDKSLRPGDRVKLFTSGIEGQTLEGVAILIQRDYQRSDSTGLEYWQVKFDSGYEVHQADNDCWRMVESQKQS